MRDDLSHAIDVFKHLQLDIEFNVHEFKDDLVLDYNSDYTSDSNCDEE